MISSDRALKILQEEGCSSSVIEHVLAVTRVSTRIAENIDRKGHDVDLDLVEVGALIHDVGRSRTHGISHGVEGARILRERNLDKLAPFAENHLGAGIKSKEAEQLGIPPKDYIPKSLEEKIVTYGDNLIRDNQEISFEEALKEFKEELGPDHPAIERFKELHREIKDLGGLD